VKKKFAIEEPSGGYQKLFFPANPSSDFETRIVKNLFPCLVVCLLTITTTIQRTPGMLRVPMNILFLAKRDLLIPIPFKMAPTPLDKIRQIDPYLSIFGCSVG